ncbi:MAG: hypothetical protein ABIU54_00650 [Candidatus Eisenbacteria bacterium]
MNCLSLIRRGLALLLLAAFVTSCSQLPTAPTTATPASGRTVLEPVGDDTNLGEITVDNAPAQGARSMRHITPKRGGSVRAGQFLVIIPPGALRRPAFISVRQLDLTKHEVELQVTPASANDFLLPVLLVADCSRMNTRLLSIQTIYRWSAARSQWEAAEGAEVDMSNKTVSVPLERFSTCKVDDEAAW